MSYDWCEHRERVSPVETYPGHVVDPKHHRVLAPSGRTSESHRSGGSRDGKVCGRDKERIDVECTR